jgi:hypothetical protein
MACCAGTSFYSGDTVGLTKMRSANEFIAFSLQQTLLGLISEDLYAVTFGVTNSTIDVVFYFYRAAFEDEKEDLRVAVTEAAADVGELGIPFEWNSYFVPLSERDPTKLDFWIYMKRDSKTEERIDPFRSVVPSRDFAEYR